MKFAAAVLAAAAFTGSALAQFTLNTPYVSPGSYRDCASFLNDVSGTVQSSASTTSSPGQAVNVSRLFSGLCELTANSVAS